MNNKKHTSIKRKLSLSILFLTIVCMLGCSPSPSPSVIIPPPPNKVDGALPSVKKASSDVGTTINNNTKIGDKIEESKKTVLDQKISILDALAQAEKIKEKALAKAMVSELDAMNLIFELKKVESRNLFLEKQNEDLKLLKDDQDKILQIIKETLEKTEVLVQDKDNEANHLREQNTYLSNNLLNKNKEVEQYKILLQKEKEISASAKVYKHWIIGLVSVFVGWLIIKNILMIYFPLTKFRI